MDDASIRDLNEGIGCHVSSALEQSLMLPRDMVELRGLRKNEVFLNIKRYLDMVLCFVAFLFRIHNCHAYMYAYSLFAMILTLLFVFFFFFGRLSKILSGWRR